jgi:hypothetical protein
MPKNLKILSLLVALQCHSHIYFANFLITYASKAGTETILAKSQHTAANMEHTLNEQNEETKLSYLTVCLFIIITLYIRIL